MTKQWPCWTCKHRSDVDTTGTYSCAKPLSEPLAIWERWTLENSLKMWRSLGTERQLKGETENETPECEHAEPRQ